MAIITLLTDFGVQDEYVGVLKGVILSTNPNATIVDISHAIPAQNITAAAHTLKASYPYFPRGTIHVAVVDPGVGTNRAIIAVLSDGHLFLAPDNGLLEPILRQGKSVTIHRVDNEMLFLHPVSRTFQGRDIFAPIAGHLSKGFSLDALGPEVEMNSVVLLEEREPQLLNSGQIVGKIVAVDRFGNLITNIHARDLAALDNSRLVITAGDVTISGLADSYAQGDSERPIAILGSRDCIEIAVNLGNAARVLHLAVGGIVRVVTPSP
jgi:S-adenosylmethionine hydrolase